MERTWARVSVLAAVAVLLVLLVGIGSPFIPTLSVRNGTVEALNLPPRTAIRPVNLTFYGNAAIGWGFDNSTISNPGPSIVVYLGDLLNLTLIPNDPLSHNWFIDYNNDLLPGAGEPSSPDFAPASPIVWNFTADRSGNWTYRCRFHQTTMTGNVTIVGGPPANRAEGKALPLITSIVLGALGFVLVFAAVYHVRAVRASKRTK